MQIIYHREAYEGNNWFIPFSSPGDYRRQRYCHSKLEVRRWVSLVSFPTILWWPKGGSWPQKVGESWGTTHTLGRAQIPARSAVGALGVHDTQAQLLAWTAMTGWMSTHRLNSVPQCVQVLGPLETVNSLGLSWSRKEREWKKRRKRGRIVGLGACVASPYLGLFPTFQN